MRKTPSPDHHNKVASKSVRKSVRKSAYKLPTNAIQAIQQQLHHNKTSASSSPPLVRLKSRQSKSKRFDQLETGITCIDYLWLVLYFAALYSFYAVLWFASWYIYSLTRPKGRPRYMNKQIAINFTDSASRSALLSCSDLV